MPCPQCGQDMPDDAILCLSCGFNRETGKTVKTEIAVARPSTPAPADEGGNRPVLRILRILLVAVIALGVFVVFHLLDAASSSDARQIAGILAKINLVAVGRLICLIAAIEIVFTAVRADGLGHIVPWIMALLAGSLVCQQSWQLVSGLCAIVVVWQVVEFLRSQRAAASGETGRK